MSSSNSPCAACKFLRRKCTQECVFAPYFPPDQPQKFSNVHKVFGASNVAKILNEINAAQREDAVNSLAYEADARLRDPVYGCVGLISILQHRLKQVQVDLYNAKKELATYIGPSDMLPILQNHSFMGNNPSSSSVIPYNMSPMMGLPSVAPHNTQLVIRESQQPHHQQILEAQQQAAMVVAREQQEMLRTYEQQQLQQQQLQQQQQQQQELVRFNSGFDQGGPVGPSGFNQMSSAAAMLPSLALGSFDGSYQIQQQPQEHSHHHELQLPSQLLLQQQQPQQPHQQQKPGSEDGRSVGPSC
ncbi:LOB domain-containing protein 36-like [Actinidia eriantha]|uniref:LOB domain-containing protein 36-like n=1 Tax=Actinidia eriantha TaxID=165200 RepID=UPI00259008EC|nr:LOB domain-containing protein 36-like [Actinidia eriantha]XP_057500920.1 LOB domain-containing protein 36-like [Actinidia eriantha]XP_057500922.1 LOB domain-containing protein 36-like [Actinidia eriantha]XP_057500923.1 LOB domain-containing protein 36-like [Actinidia eriantha]XP_057500924.1 LOB domain-containing protein 36-like [Actinidia eriantha]XP_057500925.1 LOB domain-containing protein 36-like [Actinidia eriantha]